MCTAATATHLLSVWSGNLSVPEEKKILNDCANPNKGIHDFLEQIWYLSHDPSPSQRLLTE